MAPSKLLLICGPSGSGKTTLAQRAAQEPGWTCLSEDAYWAEMKAGHPDGEARTPAEEHAVQCRVIDAAKCLLLQGRSVALEFIIYHKPPTPLFTYREALLPHCSALRVVALCPPEPVLLARKLVRGRAFEQDTALERRNAAHQLDCILCGAFPPEWLADNGALSLEESFQRWLAPFIMA